MEEERVAIPEIPSVVCGACRGKGRCGECSGVGKVRAGPLSRARIPCPTCGGSAECKSCGASGIVPWHRAWSRLTSNEKRDLVAGSLIALRSAWDKMSGADPTLLRVDSFVRVPKRRRFDFDSNPQLPKAARDALAYREYLLFEEIRNDFYRKFRDELVEAGEHVHIEDLARDAALGTIPPEFLNAVESKLRELRGAGELKSVLLFRPEDLKVDGKPLLPVIAEQARAEFVAAIADRATGKRSLVRARAPST